MAVAPSTPLTGSIDLLGKDLAQVALEIALPTPPITPSVDTTFLPPVDAEKKVHSRLLSDNELSYFLPSRAEGVNDMYVHHRLIVDAHIVDTERIAAIWAYLMVKNPLLGASVRFESYERVHFEYGTPRSVDEAIEHAQSRLKIVTAAGVDVIDDYLNGPRSLSNNVLAQLVVYIPPDVTNKEAKLEFMLCTSHFIGDGMALHTFMNEFYTLLGSDKTIADTRGLLDRELRSDHGLPPSVESRYPQRTPLAKLVGKVDNELNDARQYGKQTFPRSNAGLPRHTIVPTPSYSPADTKQILARCKAHGVTITHVMFALSNLAWQRQSSAPEPSMIYSAANMRPHMLPAKDASYFHLAVGYFNIILPNLRVPAISETDLFWHRARMTKAQTVKALKSTFAVSRSRETNKVRCERALTFARLDDGVPIPESRPKASVVEMPPGNSQKALMGVSMLGNLDGMYKHADFSAIRLQSLTTGSRQRQGGLLLFAYTFAGKLWTSLGYDENGFEKSVVERFWDDFQALVQELLLADA
ncbi:hypothetical protein Q5752_002127 [Cryptotrichosporon argae]